MADLGTNVRYIKGIGEARAAALEKLGITTTIEGVETQAQLAFLKEAGCDQIQGYLFSRPLPVATLERLLLER